MSEELTSELLLAAYSSGVFPMGDPDGEIYWYSPDPRCVLEFDRFHVSHTLRQTVRQRKFEIRIDDSFERVIDSCSNRREGTWISPPVREAYCRLNREGHAHSVEAWRDGKLAGGLYGVAIGGAFFGESMFHTARDASKVALVALMERLKQRGYALVDTQWSTPHLESFGAIEITRGEYLRRLDEAVHMPCRFKDGQAAGE
ncbi:MAG: leucyl/phenylalanyl-tRNA--protein transferase [Planctomycetes bacterium]|nr:leucyl/phenylalanyl-tRNA--protein transferase [Planctomycetota bacterium]